MNAKNPSPRTVIGTLPNGFRIYHVDGDGNCLFRAIAFFIYGSVDQHERARAEIVEQVMTHWGAYTASMPNELNDPLSYAQRLLGINDYGDHVEITAAEVLYNRPFYVWDQATF